MLLFTALCPLAALGQGTDTASPALASAQAPTISPAPGTYHGVQTVSLASPTPGAYFCYTTDGSTPTAASTWYGGPFKLSANAKVQAIAFAYNYNPSPVSSAHYDIILQAPPPTISPASGTYLTPQTVTLASSTLGAYYNYTTDGSTPTADSPWYSGPFVVSTNQTVQAVASAYNYTQSPVASASYAITPPAAAPAISPPSAAYHVVQTVTMTDATPGASIYYTTDGSKPTGASTRYGGPIAVGASESFSAVALAPGGSLGPVVKAWYTIDLPTPAPAISPAPGIYNKIQSVTMTDAVPTATIYYTLDGTFPSTSSLAYAGPISATANTLITAIAVAPNYETGPSSAAAYTIVAPPPVVTPSSGTYQTSTKVAMTDAVKGATIYWTENGAPPTTSSDVYYSPIDVAPSHSVTAVYLAFATAPGYLPSSTAISTFMVDKPAGLLAAATVGSAPTMDIPPNFLGLSTDFTQPPMMMGSDATGANLPYRTLLSNLTVNGGAPILLRLAGDDTHLSDIQADIEPLADLAKAVNIHYTLGVDLWNKSLPLAQSEASAWAAGIPNNLIEGIEIGNEPDVYRYNGARPATYSFADYLSQFQQWQQAIASSLGGGGFGFMGPSMGGATTWVPDSDAALAAGALTPTIVGQHSYLGDTTQSSGAAWPVDYLLYPIAATEYPTLYSGFASSAHQAGRLFRMDEMNSFYNGGVGGISDTFQSALWSIDLMFNYLADGMDGVNWHSGQGTRYQLYQFRSEVVNGETVFHITQVAPLYYGLLAFSQVAGNGAQLLPVATATSANVAIWATIDNASATHVVVINKDQNATGQVRITLPGYTKGSLRYLAAAVYYSTNGITLGGQTFDGSPDGAIQGSLATIPLTPVNGVFTIPNMPVTCAAIIDFTN